MALEMAEQPSVLARLVGRWDDGIEAVRRVAPRELRGVILLARGSSDHAASFGRYVIESAAGVPVSPAAPSLVTRYGRPPRARGWLLVAASQSGSTPEIVTVTERLRERGAHAIAITNDAASPLARLADAVIELGAGPELAIPATKTATAAFAAFAMTAEALGEVNWSREELVRLPVAIRECLGDTDPVQRLADDLDGDEDALLVARGFLYGAAQEGALKLKEAARMNAEAYSVADLLHGPLAAVVPDLPVIAFSSHGPVQPDVLSVQQELRNRGARVFEISDRSTADVALPPLPEPLSAITAVVRAQQLAHRLAIRRCLDPDCPRGLSKVTPTR